MADNTEKVTGMEPEVTAAAEQTAEQTCDVQEQIAQLQQAATEQEEKYKRMLAEYENFRKRSAKEKEGYYSDALAGAIGAFLPVLDNLERAVAQPDADEGVKLICRQFLEILEKYGVAACGAPGETFDPNLHNAVLHVEDESLGENVIVDVMQKGYTMRDRLIRPAMVKTAN